MSDNSNKKSKFIRDLKINSKKVQKKVSKSLDSTEKVIKKTSDKIIEGTKDVVEIAKESKIKDVLTLSLVTLLFL